MKRETFEKLAAGTLLRVAQDGKRSAGQVGQLRGRSKAGNAKLLIAGKVVAIEPERLEGLHDGTK